MRYRILEKIIREVIVDFLTTNNLINSRQHGFMKKKACFTNLLETLDFLTKCHWLKIPVVIAFIDFLKAFALVSHKRLLFKLSCYGINGSLLAWIAFFLEDRTQRVVMGNIKSSWEKVTSGVPQGSVLGAILFIIFINEISELLIYLNELYADDTKLMREIKSDSDVTILQGDIDKIVEWTRKWLMKLNENKCKVMYIGGGNEKNIFTIESYDGSIRTNLIETTLERDLGIMISADLKWRQHVILEALGLTELELRRERGDLIQLYKLFHDIDNVIWPATTNLTVNMEPVVSRRHGVQLTKELVKHSAPRYNFFSNRVVNKWNNLPSDVAYAPTLNSFKAQIDDLKYKQNLHLPQNYHNYVTYI